MNSRNYSFLKKLYRSRLMVYFHEQYIDFNHNKNNSQIQNCDNLFTESLLCTLHTTSSISNQLHPNVKEHQPPQLLTLMFVYLYFLQGIIVSFGSTMPYIYNQLPNYQVMSIFASIAIPFSFKFLTAPITEKFNFLSYGKRKTWIIISQIATCILLYSASFYTDFEKAKYFALVLISSMIFISLQDISLDCLTLKQLKTPHLVSMVSTVPHALGWFFGSLLLLKLTSKEFSQRIGLQNPITDTSSILKAFSLISLLTAIMVHIYFKETILDMEKQVHRKSFLEVLCYYRVFINPNTKYFRLVAFFLTYYQGFNFFNAGYDYELIKAGFSRDVNNTINNIIIIPITILVCVFSSKIQKFGLVKSTICSQSIIILIRAYLLACFPLRVEIIFIVNFLIQFAYTWQYMITAIMINLLPIFGVSGMLLTVLASSINFGEQKGLHTLFISIFGWRECALIGIFIQLAIIFTVPKLYDWIDQGSVQIEAEQERIPQNKQIYEITEVDIYKEVPVDIDDEMIGIKNYPIRT